jgi:MFS family permease
MQRGNRGMSGIPPEEPRASDDGDAAAVARESIAPPLPADVEARFNADVQRDLRRNVLAHMVHGLLGQTGFRLVETPTLVPAYVFMISGSTTAVGFARAAQALGALLTPIVGATIVEHRKRVLPIVFGTGLGMRLPLLAIALAGFFLPAQATLIVLCAMLAAYGFFQGMQMVTFSVLVSKVIPVEKRGSLMGRRNTLGGLAATTVALFSGSLIEQNTFGDGYASTFLVAFLLTAAGLASLIMIREPESPAVRQKSELVARMRELPALMGNDPAYRDYLIARSVGSLGRMAVPYYVIYAGQIMDLPGDKLGMLTAGFLLAQTMSSMIWGELGDRRGFRDVLSWSLGIWTVATVGLTYATQMPGVLTGFVGLGAGLGGFQLACTNLVLEFGKREDIPMRVALAQTAEGLVVVVAPLLGSLLIEGISYEAMFWTAAVVQALALLISALRVQDPRVRPA